MVVSLGQTRLWFARGRRTLWYAFLISALEAVRETPRTSVG